MKRLMGFAGALVVISAFSVAQGDTYKVLHTFTGSTSDGAMPWSCLTPIGTTLYGTTYYGGSTWDGTIYSIGMDGSGFSVQHSFVGGSGDGQHPTGGLALIGSTFYGTTNTGGSGNWGTVFQIGTNGSGFGILHSFNGGTGDGANPTSGLTVVDSTLYSNTYYGGPSNYGTIFKIGTGGSGFSLLHSFNGGSNDGLTPYGDLTAIGSTLYGMTEHGGSSHNGAIFKIGTDASGFSLLHSFVGGGNDGMNPTGRLTLVGTTLYGTTDSGGSSNRGTIFKIGMDGSGFSLLHSFSGGSNDGATAAAGLTLVGTTLYGTTYYGGPSDNGTIFKIGTDGSGYELLHNFTTDGANPFGDLTLVGSTLYGTTKFGGSKGFGNVFSLTVPEPSTFALLGIGAVSLLGFGWRRRKR